MNRTCAALLVLLVACSSARADEQPPERLEALRRIIDMEDRRETSVEAWRPLVLSEDATVARHAIRAVGRTREPKLSPLLREVLGRGATRRDVVQAMALCVDPENVDGLVSLVRAAGRDAPSPSALELASDALIALGRHGVAVPAATFIDALGNDSAEVRAAALIATSRQIGRRSRPATLDPAWSGVELANRIGTCLRSADREVSWRAAYALFDLEVLDGPLRWLNLRDVLAPGTPGVAARSFEPAARLYAARALATCAGPTDERLAVLLRLLDESHERDPHVAAAAASSIARIGSACGARLPQAVQALATTAARSAGPADFHARRAAVAALADLTRPDEVTAPAPELLVHALPAVRAALDDASPSVRIEALVAAARLAPADQAAPLVASRADAERPLDRLAAARAARHLPADARDALLERLRQDADPRVACEALGALGELAGQGGDALAHARAAARAATAHEDMAIKTTGVSLLGEHGALEDVATIAAVASRSTGSSNAEVRVECVNALKALGARGDAGAGQRHAAVTALRAALADPSAAVQVAAAKALTELTGDTVPLPPAPPTRSTVELVPEDLLRSTSENPRAILNTSKGAIAIELLADEAPRHVKSFVQLARSGFYDGLRFHRVVSGFVIQGLDPRGDGWGSGDVLVKDEINPVPYLAGAVGMPNAGPDTGGCQLFITHVPTPHLDGSYTVFGRVVDGMNVVHAIDLDDTCESVEVRD